MHNQFLQTIHARIALAGLLILAAFPCAVTAQNNLPAAPQQSLATASSVPQIIQFSGQLNETSGGAAIPSGTVSITFALYENEQGGTALWSETQNVQVDSQGRYTALLGSASSEGVPLNLFTAVQAHWLAVQPLSQGFGEQPRVLLVSAPYALKAGDAETIGGLPPSAFVRVDASSGTSGTIAGTSVVTTTVPTMGTKGSAHVTPVRLNTLCGAFCNATTGYQINGSTELSMPGNSGTNNIAVGGGALFGDTTGFANTAIGGVTLLNNSTGSDNTASGLGALEGNTTGNDNTATGVDALSSNTTGLFNTATGLAALVSNTTASNNTATGYQSLYLNTVGSPDTATGYQALYNNTGGNDNMASGYQALYGNTTGSYNTASGDGALFGNTTANYNTAIGYQALFGNTTGVASTASGYQALFSNTTGNENTASGYAALNSNGTGSNNTAIGYSALPFNTSGSNNIAIGNLAGNNVSGGNSSNIHIGSTGSFNDNGFIRIGTKGTQKKFFVAGVSGVSVANAIPVMIDSASGQLGTVSSSRRYKEDIQNMGNASDGLMRLRPVTFRYKQPFDDGSKPIQYGLIAEEVAEVYPDLVARSADGQIETVKYQLLDPMLLNEVQRQQAEIKSQNALLLQQQNQLKTQQVEIAELISNVKTIQASLHTRHGSGHARLASAKVSVASAALTNASVQDGRAVRSGN
jgi:hypothetical protein